MKLWDKLTGTAVRETVDSVGNAIDKLVTSDKERMELKSELTGLITGFVTRMTEFQKDVLLAEANGSWLQRSWRPIIMLSFGFIVVYSKFLAPAFNLPNTELEGAFWDLLNIGLGGYVVGRSAEKIIGSIADNFDKIPTRKNK